ncbi:MAG: sigma-70 family RNA polymerase sigma factor [Kiritimatiellales bacterium]|nr:sigma-70 family RNA polymerase sigma factor [Kiritimatiellales bacterium]
MENANLAEIQAASTDEDLLLAYRNEGDRAAFTALVERYRKELLNYLRRYLGNADMADDVFQATWLQVHLKSEFFEPGRKVRPWLYTVATNQAIDAKRRNSRHQILSIDHMYGDDEEGVNFQNLLTGKGHDPIENAELVEQCQLVRLAVESLPDIYREVVELIYFKGLKYREAAEELAIPVGTVKSRIHSAIHRLNIALNKEQLSLELDEDAETMVLNSITKAA